jgi:sulfur-oxidizing protein SoxY
MRIIQHNLIIKLFLACLLALINFQAHADASPDIWPYLKQQVFKDRDIHEDQNFLKIDGPKRASSGAQVPVTIALSKNTHHIKKISVFIDANPGQHAATYFLTDQSQQILINTRIRMETDSFVRAVAETETGELFMSAIPIRASGGCSGYMDVHDPELTKDLGKILIKAENNFVTSRIKHPNFTGLQKDLDSGGYIPEWIVKTIEFNHEGGQILAVENQISISQDPFLKFTLPDPLQGNITITAKDTKGNQFNSAVQIN